MNEQEITIGSRTFTFYQLKPFAAIQHGAHLKKVFMSGMAEGGLEASAIELLAGLDENFIPETVLPIFKDCAVVCTSAACKLNTPADIDTIYTVDDLDEFFILIGKVLNHTYGSTVKKTLARFGIHLDQFDLKSLIANLSKSATEKTSKTK